MTSRKKLAVLGGGESGVGAALLGKAKEFEVFLSDKGNLQDKYRSELVEAGIAFEEGGHSEARILGADLVVKSPGIPDNAPLVQALYGQQTPVISEIEFASRYTDAYLIAITGSNGKTTTTLLTYHLLKAAGLSVGLAGNIGESFAKQVLENRFAYYVLELSSFQLDNMYGFRANTAVLLNITPDHLDRYGYNFQNYVDSKFRIVRNQTPDDSFIFYNESPVIRHELAQRRIEARLLPVSLEQPVTEGAFFENGLLNFPARDAVPDLQIDYGTLPLKGPHNAINSMAAVLAARAAGVPDDVLVAALRTFRNAPHRLEPVGEKDGVRYVNDSKATNVDSVFYALGSFDTPVILILGGVDKGNDYDQIRGLVTAKVKGVIALGTDNTKLETYFRPLVPHFYATGDLDAAVRKAAEWAVREDVVLLSPACASFDLFRNYEDRGDRFREAVRRLVLSPVS